MVYSTRRFVVCLSVCHFVLVFFSPLSIAITSLEEERANLNAFRTFVRFVLVWICRFPLPLGVWEGLRFVIVALPGLFSYLFFFFNIDDAIIYNDEWNHLMGTIKAFFDKLSEAKLTINLAKSEFCHATLTFLGHVVGHGQVKPIEAKVEAISDFPVSTFKRQLMRFLGMADYYRKFCNNFSVIA